MLVEYVENSVLGCSIQNCLWWQKNRNSYIHANQTGIEYHAAFIKNTGIKMSKHIKWGE